MSDVFAGKYPTKKITDKIVRYRLKNGKFRFLILHVEFQGKAERKFVERMFEYFIYIYIKYKTKDITALALYLGASRPKIYNIFNLVCFGTKLTYEFNTYTVREQKEDALLKSDNPMAIAILASLYMIKAGQDPNLKFAYKKNLIEIARKKNFDSAKLLRLLNFVKYLVKLPENLELEYTKFIAPPKNEKEMEYTEDFLTEVAPNTIKAIRAESMEKGRAELEKEREEFIMNWRDKLGYNAEQIAPMMPKLTVKYIQSVIDKFEKKNKRK